MCLKRKMITKTRNLIIVFILQFIIFGNAVASNEFLIETANEEPTSRIYNQTIR